MHMVARPSIEDGAGGARWSTSPAGPTGSRRSTWRWLRWRFFVPDRGDSRWLCWGFVAYLFATWWLLTHRVDRFWLPLLAAAGGARGPGGRLGPQPGLVDPPGHRS